MVDDIQYMVFGIQYMVCPYNGIIQGGDRVLTEGLLGKVLSIAHMDFFYRLGIPFWVSLKQEPCYLLGSISGGPLIFRNSNILACTWVALGIHRHISYLCT